MEEDDDDDDDNDDINTWFVNAKLLRQDQPAYTSVGYLFLKYGQPLANTLHLSVR